MSGDFCGHCGEPAAELAPGQLPTGAGPSANAHDRCRERLAMEPPRYCAQCRRRLKVQVTPLAWSAECSRHGRLAS